MTDNPEACFSPKIFTTHPKNGKRKPNKKIIEQNNAHSIAQSMPFSNDTNKVDLELFGGEIVHLSFDCPINLRTAFNQATKANGTSACQILRLFMSAYVKSNYGKEHATSNTITQSSPIIIKKLETNQYVQTRPRRLIRHVEPQNVGVNGSLTCQIGSCSEVAIAEGIYRNDGKTYRLCSNHLNGYCSLPEWRIKR